MTNTQRPERNSDTANVLSVTVDMPWVNAEAGENWAEVAFDAWTAAADLAGVDVEEMYFDGGTWIGDGKTVAEIRVGAEWYYVEWCYGDGEGSVRAVFVR